MPASSCSGSHLPLPLPVPSATQTSCVPCHALQPPLLLPRHQPMQRPLPRALCTRVPLPSGTRCSAGTNLQRRTVRFQHSMRAACFVKLGCGTSASHSRLAAPPFPIAIFISSVFQCASSYIAQRSCSPSSRVFPAVNPLPPLPHTQLMRAACTCVPMGRATELPAYRLKLLRNTSATRRDASTLCARIPYTTHPYFGSTIRINAPSRVGHQKSASDIVIFFEAREGGPPTWS